MSSPQIPPRTEPMVDTDKNVTLPWQSFFEATAQGDPGNTWSPTFQNLVITGTANIAGTYYYLSNKLAYFRVTITPDSGSSTTAVAGSTYCDNFPIAIGADSGSFTIGGSGAAVAAVTSVTKRIYTGSWTTATVPISLTGIAELQ